ncbi:hypothetical protein FRC00_006858 [Tulasnella sp. 408]|nr:hypothetical protein FRC00_006858 [Tulasnella sp. 408]
MATLVTKRSSVTMESLDDIRGIDHGRQTEDSTVYTHGAERGLSPGPHCHIGNLPEEVLLMVFSFVLLEDPYTIPRSQRTTLLLVCKAWTRVVTESRYFWTAIDCSSTKLEQEWDRALSLSKGLPLTIECRGEGLRHSAAHKVNALLYWAIVKSVRIRRFRCRVRNWVDTWALVWQALIQSRLSLEGIELFSIMADARYLPNQDRTFLGAHAPKLQSLTLQSVVVPWALCAIPTLRELSISFNYRPLMSPSDFLPTPVEIVSILASTPLLETLHLAGIGKHSTELSTAPQVVSPQQLKELNVEGLSNGALCCLAGSLDLPPTAKVNFTIVEPEWRRRDVDAETEFAQLVSRLAKSSLLQDCHLELEETALRAINVCCGVRLSNGARIDYKRAFGGLSGEARAQVVSASISSMYCEDSREPLEAIHDTFPGVTLLRFPVYRLGSGYGGWPRILEDREREAGRNYPQSLCPRLTAIEVDIDVMIGLDFSELLSFIRARNSPNRHKEDEEHPHPILRLRITAPSKRLPAFQRGIWKEIETLVMTCQFEATSWEYDEDGTDSSEEGHEDD